MSVFSISSRVPATVSTLAEGKKFYKDNINAPYIVKGVRQTTTVRGGGIKKLDLAVIRCCSDGRNGGNDHRLLCRVAEDKFGNEVYIAKNGMMYLKNVGDALASRVDYAK